MHVLICYKCFPIFTSSETRCMWHRKCANAPKSSKMHWIELASTLGKRYRPLRIFWCILTFCGQVILPDEVAVGRSTAPMTHYIRFLNTVSRSARHARSNGSIRFVIRYLWNWSISCPSLLASERTFVGLAPERYFFAWFWKSDHISPGQVDYGASNGEKINIIFDS